MNARNKLEKRLVAVVSGETPVNAETINGILKDYTISREDAEEKSDLKKEYGTIWEQKELAGPAHGAAPCGRRKGKHKGKRR